MGLNSNYLPEEREFRERIQSLSDGHLEVLALTALGYLNKQIAWVRGSSEATVKSQQKEILRRLGLRSRTQAAVQFHASKGSGPRPADRPSMTGRLQVTMSISRSHAAARKWRILRRGGGQALR